MALNLEKQLIFVRPLFILPAQPEKLTLRSMELIITTR